MSSIIHLFRQFNEELIDWNNVANKARTPVDIKVKVQQQRDYYLSEVKEYLQAEIDNDVVELMDGLCDVYFTEEYLHYLTKSPSGTERTYIEYYNDLIERGVFTDVQIFDCLEEVFRSNWTKFPLLAYVDQAWELSYLEDKYGCPVLLNAVEDATGALRAVFINPDNKVLKPSGFEEPRIKEILENE